MKKTKDLIETFVHNAEINPSNVSVYYREKTLTYAQLDQLSDVLALKLKMLGVKPASIIPVVMDRSIEFVISVFAILKLGAAYLPISLELPEERILFLINKGTEDLFLVSDKFFVLPSLKNVLVVSETELSHAELIINKKELHSNYNGKDPAYVIFTSGSTGEPKGVVISRDSLNVRINEIETVIFFNYGQRYLFGTNPTFDVSVSEIFGWINGVGSLVILPQESKHNAFSLFWSSIIDFKVTHAAVSPSVLNQLIIYSDADVLSNVNKSLKYLSVAGEAFQWSLFEKVSEALPLVNVLNMYGPTETTVYASSYIISKDKRSLGPLVPIGKPIGGVQFKISDNGELLIGGTGVFSEYLGLIDLTLEKMIKINGEYYYQTGDLVHVEGGEFVYDGRIDHQIKINGIRIEPGEIEFAFNKIGYNEIYVIYSNGMLVAFVSGDKKATSRIKSELGQHVPDYMIPSIYIFLDKLPVNTSGKVDRNKLLDLFNNYVAVSNDKVTDEVSRNSSLYGVLQIINHTLKGRGLVSANDNLHDAGLDSLKLVTILIELEKKFKIKCKNDFLNEFKTPFDIDVEINNLIAKNVVINNKIYLSEIPTSEVFKIKNDLLEQSKSIEHYFVNDFPVDTFSASNFQKSYIHFNFDLSIETNINVENRSFDEVLRALNLTLDCCDVFRTSFVFDGNQLMACYHEARPLFKIPVIDLSNVTKDVMNSITADISSHIRKNFNTKNVKSPFYGMYIVCLGESKWNIKLVLHHAHCDAYSSGILQRLFFDYISGGGNVIPPTLKDYLLLIRECNSKFNAREESITEELISAQRQGPHDFSGEIFKETVNVIDLPERLPTISKILLASAIITSEACKKLNVPVIAFQCLFDFRKIKGFDFSKLVGDCHLSMSFVRYSSDNDLRFMNKALAHFRNFHENKGYQINELVFGNIPDIGADQQSLLNIYERCLVKVNFVGEKNQDQADEIIKSIHDTRQSLSKARKQIRFQVFSVESKLYICQL
ncbi:MAG: non-ribosomal peptide synthetase [Bacteriovorax sp.]|nr:non-ribosomal peptide synthetase [Bacteriovorax sp.]